MGDKVVVVGLGLFGSALASALVKTGYDVLAIDRRSDPVKEFADTIRVVQGDATSKVLWDDLHLRDYRVAVVAFSSSVESSILVALLLRKIGIPQIIAKSNGELHSEALRAIGVSAVVQPQQETGRRLAHVLGANIEDYLEVFHDYGIARIVTAETLVGKTCAQIEDKHGATILALRRGENVLIAPGSKEQVRTADTLFIAAKDEVLRKLGT